MLDPYVGSGTTCLAAKLLGSNYVGIDISKEYIKDAKGRISNHLHYDEIVGEEVAKHIVERTFKDRKNNNANTGKYRSILLSQVKLL